MTEVFYRRVFDGIDRVACRPESRKFLEVVTAVAVGERPASALNYFSRTYHQQQCVGC